MKEILITSSVLILALLLLRQAFRKSLSRRVQYALWGLVALRLLVPASLPAADFSVLTAADPVLERMEGQSLYLGPGREISAGPAGAGTVEPGRWAVAGPASPENTYIHEEPGQGVHEAEHRRQTVLSDLLRTVWHAGTALMAAWFLWANLRLYVRLRKNRTPFAAEGVDRPVWLVGEGVLSSPCLFGRSVYLTPAAVAEPERLRHVLAHELTHARYLDPLWSLLRCVCLALYWFDPLVWAAALASRTDCELACDEGALRLLGEEERIPYGETLLKLIPVRSRPGDPFVTATTMTADKRRLKERVTRIAENRRTRLAVIAAVLALAVVIAAVTFTGAKKRAEPPAGEPVALTAEELEQFEDLLFSREDAAIRAQFLSSFYDAPENVDLYELFYNSTGRPGALGMEERQAVADADYGGEDPGIDLIKCPSAEIEAVLNRYTNTTLRAGDVRRSSNRVHLDRFTYLPAYDAYYHFHGDANAFGSVTFLAGERQGNFVRLYYDAGGMFFGGEFGEGTACLTLEEYPGEAVDGFGWYFVSNLPAELPEGLAPAGEPEAPAPAGSPAQGVSADVPEAVRRRAESWVTDELAKTGKDDDYDPFAFDGWRVQSLAHAYTYENCHGMDVAVYRMNYEFHSARPEEAEARLAGGMYITEDGWVCPTYPNRTWLFFRADGDGYLFSFMANDCIPGSEPFTSELEHMFFNHPEVLPAGSVGPIAHTQAEYDAAVRAVERRLNELGAHPNTTALRIQSLSVDEAEAGRVLSPWAATPLAAPSPLTNELARRIIAVRAAYDVQWISAVEAWGLQSGPAVEFFYLLPDENGGWYIWEERTVPQDGEAPALPVTPAARDSFDEAGIQNAVSRTLAEWEALPGVTELFLMNSGVDEAETARIVAQYAGSETAHKHVWTDAYVARMTAVRVVVEVKLDAAAMTADTASLNWDEGVNAMYLYVLPPHGLEPSEHTHEGWDVWMAMSCAVPEKYQQGTAALPHDKAALETVTTRYASYSEAYAQEITQRQESGLFQLLEEQPMKDCTVFSWAYIGTPHGTDGNLTLIYTDGTVVRLPLPRRSDGAPADPAKDLVIDANRTELSYTASFGRTEGTADGSTIVHRAGTYYYTYDTAARTLELRIAES